MTPIFTTAMVGVTLQKPWQPTHMKSYAKGRAPHRVWTRMVTDREAKKERAKEDRQYQKKMNAVLRKFATAAGITMNEARSYLIAHAEEIFK